MKDKGVHDSSQSDDNNEALKRSPSSVVPSFSIPGELRNKFHVDLVVCFYLVSVYRKVIYPCTLALDNILSHRKFENNYSPLSLISIFIIVSYMKLEDFSSKGLKTFSSIIIEY